MFDRLQGDAKNVVKRVIELVYFMRGAISYEEMMRRTPGERQMIDEFLGQRLEIEKKNPHPIY